jgi:ABC-2 type transport system ATP-binding protein
MSSILDVSQVSLSFRVGFWLKRIEVLHNVDLKVPHRAIFGFLGANGAGKTTLITLITGLRRPTSGTLLVDGLVADTKAARARIGYLPERPYFPEHLTGEDFLKYFGALSAMSRSQIQARIPSVLATVGMTAARKVELRRYSKGMLQRIGIAQAILHDPEFLVLDEPMSGLDPIGRKEIRELITQFASEGRTVFFSSHVIPDVEAICDQIALIEKGRILSCGPIGQFLGQGPLHTEIGFSGIPGDIAEKIAEFTSFRQMPDGYRASVTGQDAVSVVLGNLLKAKAKILWVTPIRPSLEGLFEEREERTHG